MSAIFFLIGCSILIALIFLLAFFWANATGQHEDTYTPSMRILWDDNLSDEQDKTEQKEEVQTNSSP